MTAPKIAFVPLALEHLDLLHGWLQQPHVREFWDDGHRTREQVKSHCFGPARDALAFVVCLGGCLAGYLQAYRVGPESAYGQWCSPHGETWGPDLLLGEAADTGQGHGLRVILAFTVFWMGHHPDLSRLLIDPDVRNTRAVCTYQRAGFSGVGEVAGPAAALQILAYNLWTRCKSSVRGQAPSWLMELMLLALLVFVSSLTVLIQVSQQRSKVAFVPVRVRRSP